MSDIKPYMKPPYLIKISGNDYLTVPGRLMMFRDDMTINGTKGSIETEISAMGDLIIVKAFVLIDGILTATGYSTVRSGTGQKWAGREVEKAETASIGRALAHAGYGTQFALADMVEDDYIADSPIQAQPKQKSAPKVDSKAEIEQMQQASINQAKKDMLQKLSEDPTIRSAEYYPNYNHLVNTMKKYKDEFGTEALDDGFVAVVANLINRKHPEVEQS